MCLCLLTALLLVACNGSEPAETCIETAATGAATEPETNVETENEHETETETQAQPTDKMTIGGIGISEFTIVRAPDMPEGQKTVLDDLVTYIAKATGVTLPVITSEQTAEHEIIVGNHVRENAKVTAAVSEIQNDGYAIVEDGGDLYITASTGRGVAFAMYDFLEKYVGVRFYAHDCIMVKEEAIVQIPANHRDVFSPSFALRGRYYPSYAPIVKGWGALLKHMEGSMQGYGDNVYFKTYSGHHLNDLAEQGGWLDPTPCMTDEAIYQTVLKNVLARIEANPTFDAIRVGISDGLSHGCQCENCLAVDAAYNSVCGAYLVFIDRLAREVAEIHPNVKIFIFAYSYVHEAPQGLDLHENVMVNFCTDRACFSHAFNDPDCPKNVAMMEELRAWRAICDKVVIYDYGSNFSKPEALDPNPFVMLKNYRAMADLGIYGYGPEIWTTNASDFDELRLYLIRNVMWNPMMTDEEFDTLITEFMNDYYGAAAPYVTEYLRATTEASLTPGWWMDGKIKEKNGCTAMYTDQATFFNAYNEDGSKNTAFTSEMMELWSQAKNADLTEEQLTRVERTSTHFYKWYYYYFPHASGKDRKAVYDYLVYLCNKFRFSVTA